MVARNFIKHVVKACSSEMRSILSKNVGLFSRFGLRAPIRDFTSATQNHESQEGPITKTVRYADPLADYSLKKLFKEPGNKDLFIGFLNKMLHKSGDEEITHVTLLDTENTRYRAGIILDITCHDKSGHEYIVNMKKLVSRARGKRFFNRSLNYLCMTHAQHVLSQGTKNEELKPTVSLIITDAIMFDEKGSYWTNYKVAKEGPRAHPEDFSFVVVELPKVDTTKVPETEEEEWLQLLTKGFLVAQDPEVKCPIVRKVYDVLDMHKWTQEERAAYEHQRILALD